MAKRTFYKNLGITPIYQTDESTWEFIDEEYIKGVIDPFTGVLANAEIVRKRFISSGCALCALSMYLGITPQEAIAMGATTKTVPTVINWLGTEDVRCIYKFPAKKNYIADLARRSIEKEKSAIIVVPGHFVVVNGFNGSLSLSPEKLIYYTDASPAMISINDPYRGRCGNVSSLFTEYSSSFYFRI